MHDYVIRYAFKKKNNSTSWFRLYKSGWIEQGGSFTGITPSANSGTHHRALFPLDMYDPRDIDIEIEMPEPPYSTSKSVLSESSNPALLLHFSSNSYDIPGSPGTVENFYVGNGMHGTCWRIVGKSIHSYNRR